MNELQTFNRLLCTRFRTHLRSQNVPVIPVGPLGATPLSDAVDHCL